MVGVTPTDDEFKALPSFMEVREQSSSAARLFSGHKRELLLGFFPGNTPEVPQWPEGQAPLMSVYRPYNSSVECCCALVNPQEVWVRSASGATVGRVEQELRLWDFFRWMKGFDENGRHIYTFKGPSGFDGRFPNIVVTDANNEDVVVAVIRNMWPGFNVRGIFGGSMASNYVVEFPEDATTQQRALMVGGALFYDFLLEDIQHD